MLVHQGKRTRLFVLRRWLATVLVFLVFVGFLAFFVGLELLLRNRRRFTLRRLPPVCLIMSSNVC